MSRLDRLPLWPLAIGALTLGSAPFAPMPHLGKKLGTLLGGTLTRPVDILGLVIHGPVPAPLILRLLRGTWRGGRQSQ